MIDGTSDHQDIAHIDDVTVSNSSNGYRTALPGAIPVGMAMPDTAGRTLRTTVTIGVGVLVVLSALMAGSPALAETAGGLLLVWLSIVAGADVTSRVIAERDAGRELIWDLLLVFIVLAGLVGFGLIAQGLG